jgi:hypothetical protein
MRGGSGRLSYSRGVTLATIAWQSDAGADWCSLEGDADWLSLGGQAIVVERSIPYLISYVVGLDPEWQTRQVIVEVLNPGCDQFIRLAVENGTWTRDDEALPGLAGCVDVDLAFTPATNTLPIRRLGLEVGDAAEVHAAWVRWPELDVVRAEQRYERLAADRYRYTQDDFSAEIMVDSDGFVVEYEDVWRAIGRA